MVTESSCWWLFSHAGDFSKNRSPTSKIDRQHLKVVTNIDGEPQKMTKLIYSFRAHVLTIPDWRVAAWSASVALKYFFFVVQSFQSGITFKKLFTSTIRMLQFKLWDWKPQKANDSLVSSWTVSLHSLWTISYRHERAIFLGLLIPNNCVEGLGEGLAKLERNRPKIRGPKRKYHRRESNIPG